MTKKLKSLNAASDLIFSELGKDVRLAAPLGLGKPNQLINKIYETVKNDPKIKLKIFTALSLEPPKATGIDSLEGRFLNPFSERYYGADYPNLKYVEDLKNKKVPSHIEIHEFYFQAGKYSSVINQQQNYISVNYTHAVPVIHDIGINVLVQMVAMSKDGQRYSLSCNPDLSLDLLDYYKKLQKPLLIIGVVHPDLPFLGGDAEVGENFFDALVISPEISHKLFAVPRTEVDAEDHLIGFHASQVVQDDGTLQIGIGSLGDALVHSMIFRHKNTAIYKEAVAEFWRSSSYPKGISLFQEAFERGLYATSEMLMDGFMHLRKAGLLTRTICDQDEKKRRYMHGAFYLGSTDFYQWLRELKDEDYDGLSMTRVSKVNDLYDAHEWALRRQRKNARFFNTCMNITLIGGAASETLEDGRVISGVGGQYNFVSMAHELPDAHSVLMLRSTRTNNGKRVSNIVWSQGHLTIPRHLRDTVITEYGIAYIRGQSDQEVIKRLLNITDSQFQEELLAKAKQEGKIASDYQIPEQARFNTPQKIQAFVEKYRKQNLFHPFPFGNDFTIPEYNLYRALQFLKKQSKTSLLKLLLSTTPRKNFDPELTRMKLNTAVGFKERIYRKLVLKSLEKTAL
jgi:hypothetical protein